jgi:hypothetical protein
VGCAVDEGKIKVSVAAKVADLPKKAQNDIARAENPTKEAKKALRAQKGETLKPYKSQAVMLEERVEDVGKGSPGEQASIQGKCPSDGGV